MNELWCYIEGERDIFSVSMSPNHTIDDLKKQICDEQHSKLIAQCSPSDLTLKKVDVNYDDETKKKINAGQCQPTVNDQVLNGMEFISDVWERPPDGHIHVSVGLPSGVGDPTLVNTGGNGFLDSALVREYEDIFIKVKEWRNFESSDIERNGIHICGDGGTPVPDFVAKLERELHSKVGLEPDVYDAYKGICNVELLDAYFGPLKRGTAEDGSPEEFTFESESHRCAGEIEVKYLKRLASNNQGRCKQDLRSTRWRQMSIEVLFFYLQSSTAQVRRIIIALSDESWPLNLITKCETIRSVNEQIRKFRPFNDLLFLKSSLPRILLNFELYSKREREWPEDLILMLLTGAAIVRFANRFLDTFIAKDFVLFAIYIRPSGKVNRYLLFQEPNNPVVRCKETSYGLNNWAGWAEFVRQFYNLCHVLEREKEAEDTEVKIEQLQSMINQHDKKYPMKSFGSVSATDFAEVKPEVIVDDDGRTWVPLL